MALIERRVWKCQNCKHVWTTYDGDTPTDCPMTQSEPRLCNDGSEIVELPYTAE